MHRYAENLVAFVHCPNAVLLLRMIGTTCNDAYSKAPWRNDNECFQFLHNLVMDRIYIKIKFPHTRRHPSFGKLKPQTPSLLIMCNRKNCCLFCLLSDSRKKQPAVCCLSQYSSDNFRVELIAVVSHLPTYWQRIFPHMIALNGILILTSLKSAMMIFSTLCLWENHGLQDNHKFLSELQAMIHFCGTIG